MNADDVRGHSFYPDEETLTRIPRLYATEETPLDDKIAYLHYFVGGCDWYVFELGEDRRVAFGWANLGDPQNAELGYVDLVELRNLLVRVDGFPLVVERDLHWTPRPFGEVSSDRE